MIKIEVKNIKGKEVVSVGDHLFHEYRKYSSNKQMIASLELIGVIGDITSFRKVHCSNGLSWKHANNKAIGDILGCSINQFRKHLNGLLYKTFVAKYDNYFIKEFCLNPIKKSIDVNKLNVLSKSYDKLVTTKCDGLEHILPYVFTFNKTPKELREIFGKGVWKKMCSFSKTRNKLISNNLRPFCASTVIDVIDTPSTLLKQKFPLLFSKYAAKNLKGAWGDKTKLEYFYPIFDDCVRMFQQEGLKFNMNWSITRVKEEHDKLVSIVNARKYSSDKFDWTVDFKHKEFTIGDYTVKLLDNARDIADEGTCMKHCVGSYADQSRAGKYAVFSVLKGEEKYSTIGFNLTNTLHGEKLFHFQQHYKKYNAQVDCEIAKSIPGLICGEIHKEIKLTHC